MNAVIVTQKKDISVAKSRLSRTSRIARESIVEDVESTLSDLHDEGDSLGHASVLVSPLMGGAG